MDPTFSALPGKDKREANASQAARQLVDHQEEVKMKKSTFVGTLAAATVAAGFAAAGTLDDVKAKGFVQCGVSTGLVGFAAADANGNWDGFDVSVCRAVAAAVLGDPQAVKFVPTTGKTRFTALASGEVDLLARNTTWTFSRDVDLKFDFHRCKLLRWSGLYGSKRTGRFICQRSGRRNCMYPNWYNNRAELG